VLTRREYYARRLDTNGETFYDLPFIVAVFFVVAATIIVLTLVVDLHYGLLDPPIRLRAKNA
jgi:ABC-type dipeptide/oligopeptide/nickel transport system permease component